MSEVLYRKYRSQNFDELIGQEHITHILKNAVKSSSYSHAYLFVGSRGTGKTSTARILAKAINCKNSSVEGNPCNECSSCNSITEGNYLDLIEIDAASNRGIDQIRELKEKIEFSPSEGEYKIYIIDEVHMLTTEAFNALLKTLEEPPSHVLFMLATTDVHKLPATILSRCQRYDFRLGGDDQIREVIESAADRESVTLTSGALELLVENANGSYRDSLSLLDVVISGQIKGDNPNEVTEEEVRSLLGIPDATMVYHLLDKLTQHDAAGALDLIEEIESRGVNVQQFIKYILSALRTILVCDLRGSKSEYDFAEKLDRRETLRWINIFLEVERKTKYSNMPAMVIELAVAEICITNSQGSKVSSKPVIKQMPNNPAPVVASILKEGVLDSSTVKENMIVEDDKGLVETVSISEEVSEPEFEESLVDDAPTNTDLDIEVINSKWEGLLEAVQSLNGHLYGFMKTARVVELYEGSLVLHVPFAFHKDRIEEPKTKDALLNIFREIYGTNVPLKCEVNDAVKQKKKVSADVILRNVPKPVEPAKSEDISAPSSGKPVNDKPPPAKISKKVEAIFAGM
jgi:DNA polymerase-3 subunit gamma/tau